MLNDDVVCYVGAVADKALQVSSPVTLLLAHARQDNLISQGYQMWTKPNLPVLPRLSCAEPNLRSVRRSSRKHPGLRSREGLLDVPRSSV